MDFNKFVNQCFICRLDGNSLIFILWLILLLLPLLNSIEGYGFKFNKEQEEREEQTLKIKFLRDEILKENSIPKISELEEKLEIMKRMFKQEEKIAIILSELTKIQEKSTDKQIAQILTHVKKELNCLV